MGVGIMACSLPHSTLVPGGFSNTDTSRINKRGPRLWCIYEFELGDYSVPLPQTYTYIPTARNLDFTILVIYAPL